MKILSLLSLLALISAWGCSGESEDKLPTNPDALADLAESDDSDAQFRLGSLHYDGEGVDEDEERAVHCCQEAAKQGHADAQYLLGIMFAEGEGVSADATQAASWYGKAAEQGHAGALFRLGRMHGHGEGIPENAEKAAELWRRSLALRRDKGEAGDPHAQLCVGAFHQFGYGVRPDIGKAIVWYLKAAQQGYAPAQYALGVLGIDVLWVVCDADAGMPSGMMLNESVSWVKKGREKEVHQPLYDVDWLYGVRAPQNREDAINWLHRAAKQGHARSQFVLGLIKCNRAPPQTWDELLDIDRDGRDVEGGVKWIAKAADQGFAPAQLELAHLLQSVGVDGAKLSREDPRVVGLIRQAAESGLSAAMIELGGLHRDGAGVSRDGEAHQDWLRRATAQYSQLAERGNVYAQLRIGSACAEGAGVPRDGARAFAWWSKAAERGSPDAMMMMVACFDHGLSVRQDDRQAEAWLAKAAHRGQTKAQVNLAQRIGNREADLPASGNKVSANTADDTAIRLWLQAAWRGHYMAITMVMFNRHDPAWARYTKLEGPPSTQPATVRRTPVEARDRYLDLSKAELVRRVSAAWAKDVVTLIDAGRHKTLGTRDGMTAVSRLMDLCGDKHEAVIVRWASAKGLPRPVVRAHVTLVRGFVPGDVFGKRGFQLTQDLAR